MPNSSIITAKGAGLVKGGVASPEATNMQDYNGFDRSTSFYQTQRFAEISPIFSKKFISGDKIRIRSTHDLRSYTLKSPLMSNVYMHRSFFSVPLQAIYHNTFKPFFVNPVKGSDITDDVKPKWSMQFVRGHATTSIYISLISGQQYVNTSTSDARSIKYINVLFLLMQMMSKDGLLQKLGYSMTGFDVDVLYNHFYKIFDGTYQSDCRISYKNNAGVTCTLDISANTLTFSGNTYTLTFEKFRSIFYDLVNNKYEITSFYWDVNEAGGDQGQQTEYSQILSNIPSYNTDEYINPEKLIAYQMVCAQFFTNSYVDDIHDAFNWLNNNLSIVNTTAPLISTSRKPSFTLNGVVYNYDLISNYNYVTMCQMGLSIYSNVSTTLSSLPITYVLRNIFEVQYSLRTSDYFVDSRTQPLAVGNVYSAVVANQVSAIDINISLWQQRFLNAVNRLPYHIENYLKGIFGFEPQTKEPKPYFISKERFLIGGQEVENTADTEQGKVVTNLRTVESRYVFETFTSEPCVIIGLNSYSMEYAYGTSMDKEFIEFDRFDNFNPFLQHAGDQILYARELDNNPARFSLTNSIFAYQLRYMQYKKSIPAHASGGFLDNLPSWIALYEKTGSYGNNAYLNSDFIRNANVDFDDFYSSLTGFNPCEYFHFIARFDTICHVNSKQQKYPSLV